MEFKQKLENYADLICRYGLNLQKGQILNLGSEAVTSELALLVAEKAYQLGARFVNYRVNYPKLTKFRIQHGEDFEYVPKYVQSLYQELIDEQAATCSILGAENPDELVGLDAKKMNQVRMANYFASKSFYDEGIDQGKVQWTLAVAATPKWAVKIFPNDTVEQALERLWEEIFKICRVDQENYLELWHEHEVILKKRCKFLNDLKIKSLHFQGPGTDLEVGLNEAAIFVGGRSDSARGIPFEANLPTEECFTTPDYRKTKGHFTATRPFRVNGTMVDGLRLEFEDGVINKASANSGIDVFTEYYQSDVGAGRLGEVALVGIDSPVYKSGLVFDEVLFDENAACHVAIGSAYKSAIKNGPKLSEKELEEVGVNESSVHQDMMISSEEVSVTANCFNSEQVTLIENGNWIVEG